MSLFCYYADWSVAVLSWTWRFCARSTSRMLSHNSQLGVWLRSRVSTDIPWANVRMLAEGVSTGELADCGLENWLITVTVLPLPHNDNEYLKGRRRMWRKETNKRTKREITGLHVNVGEPHNGQLKKMKKFLALIWINEFQNSDNI